MNRIRFVSRRSSFPGRAMKSSVVSLDIPPISCASPRLTPFFTTSVMAATSSFEEHETTRRRTPSRNMFFFNGFSSLLRSKDPIFHECPPITDPSLIETLFISKTQSNDASFSKDYRPSVKILAVSRSRSAFSNSPIFL